VEKMETNLRNNLFQELGGELYNIAGNESDDTVFVITRGLALYKKIMEYLYHNATETDKRRYDNGLEITNEIIHDEYQKEFWEERKFKNEFYGTIRQPLNRIVQNLNFKPGDVMYEEGIELYKGVTEFFWKNSTGEEKAVYHKKILTNT
jgi:hypothetical protein